MRFRLSKSISPFVSWEINRCVIHVVAAITLRAYEMHLFSLKIAFWRVENFLSFFNKFSEKRNWLTFQLNAALDVMTREHFGSREFVVRFIVVVVVLEVRAHPARRRLVLLLARSSSPKPVPAVHSMRSFISSIDKGVALNGENIWRLPSPGRHIGAARWSPGW